MPPWKTSRLTLRAFTPEDAAFIVELLNDPDWLRFIGDRKVGTIDDACNYLRNGPIAHEARHGFALGAVQQLRGAHFMSHTLWTAWICWTLGWLADPLFRGEANRQALPST
mgnify:CR=1 FL=1